jgi:DNA-binding CsgD family transcriptional regulator
MDPKGRESLGLVEGLYSAALAQEAWPEFLDELRRYFGAAAAGVSTVTFQPDTDLVQRWSGLSPEFERKYLAHYWQVDPWVEPGLKRPVGDCVIGSELIPDSALERSTFYAELGRHHGVHRLLGVVVRRNERQATWCSVVRERSSKDFSRSDQQKLAGLAPHIKRALDVARRMKFADAILSTFDRLPHALLIVNGRGQISRLTPAAQELLSLRQGLFVRAGCIAAECLEDQARLQYVIAHTARSGTPPSPRGEPLAIARPRAGRSALLAHVLPCASASPALDSDGTALVFVVDPETDARSAVEHVQRALGLTRAEARLALTLGQGTALRSAADELGVSYQTARTQLRDIFSKTGIHRQAELVRLIANLAVSPSSPAASTVAEK